jgi:hypothetical protein
MKPFQVPGAIVKISTLAHSLRLVLDTQENLSDEAKARLFELHNKLGWFTFNVHQIEAESLVDLPELKTDSNKTPSQRLRAVLYLNWKQDAAGFKDFDSYYVSYMEKIITHLKEKLA